MKNKSEQPLKENRQHMKMFVFGPKLNWVLQSKRTIYLLLLPHLPVLKISHLPALLIPGCSVHLSVAFNFSSPSFPPAKAAFLPYTWHYPSRPVTSLFSLIAHLSNLEMVDCYPSSSSMSFMSFLVRTLKSSKYPKEQATVD